MLICRSCRAEQIKGTLFCSECGADLEIPAVPTFDLAEDESPPAPARPGSAEANSARAIAYNPNFNSPVAGPGYSKAPPEDRYEPIAPRPPAYSPPTPSYPPVASNSNFTIPPRPARAMITSSPHGAIRDDLRLIVLNSGRVLEFPDKESIIVGRFDAVTGERPDIDLTPDSAVELGVSRRHVCITFRDGAPFLTDLGSKNYTFLNRQQMMRGQPYPLQNGDEVRLGNVILKVLYDPDGLL